MNERHISIKKLAEINKNDQKTETIVAKTEDHNCGFEKTCENKKKGGK
jgi:hypothetical protein